MRRWFRRFRDEPPGVWLGRPHPGARWRHGGHVFTLTAVHYEVDTMSGQSVVTLRYEGGIDLTERWPASLAFGQMWNVPEQTTQGGRA